LTSRDLVLTVDKRLNFIMASSAVFIGPELKGRDKWLGGELGCDGNIYGVSLESTIASTIMFQSRLTSPFNPSIDFDALKFLCLL
jgi:hypothetical protein